MQSPDPYLIFTRKLGALGLDYMVTGSVAAIFYGEPRLTNDVDIVVYLRSGDVEKIIDAFPESEFYCPPVEVIAMEQARGQRGHFNLIHHTTGFKADVFLVATDPLHRWGLENILEAQLDGDVVSFAPPEYVIVRKLQFFREGGLSKHLRDIERIMEGLGEDWSRKDLDSFISEHRLEPEWLQIVKAS